MKKAVFIFTSLLMLSSYSPAYSETAAESKEAIQFMKKMETIQKSIKTGKITLPNNLAEMNLNNNIRYIPPQAAETMLVDVWGNQPGSGNNSQGMLIPKGVDITSPESWGVVITYEEDGHVSDEEAERINYDDLMKQMQDSVKEATKEEGSPQVELVGWADKPYYDKGSHKMYWAKELKFNGETENTLNYNVRILGRKGILVLNAVSSMNNLTNIKKSMSDIIGFTEFTKGNKYTDFNPSSDKIAEYGLTALILGGVAAKTGLFAKLFALIIAFKKILIFGVLAVVGFVGKLFGRNKEKEA